MDICNGMQPSNQKKNKNELLIHTRALMKLKQSHTEPKKPDLTPPKKKIHAT